MKKLDSLTALRFFAAVAIVIEHSRPLFRSMDWIPNFHYDFGVSFFFVLSGFILCCAYRSFDTAASVRAFYVARIARVWPLHLFMLGTFLMVTPIGGWFPGDTDGHKTGIFFANVLLIHAWIPSVAFFFGLNAVSWSISTEVFFYLIFPILRHRWEITWHWKSLLVLLFVFCILTITTVWNVAPINANEPLAASSVGWGYISPFVRLIEFVMGMLAASIYEALRKRRLSESVIVWTVLEIGATVLIVGVDRMFGYSVKSTWDIFSPFLGAAPLFALFVLIFAFGRGVISRHISMRPLLILGEASFALYLSHLLLLNVFARHLADFDAPDYVLCIGYWITSIAIALLLWKFVEAPVRDKIRKIASPNPSPSVCVKVM